MMSEWQLLIEFAVVVWLKKFTCIKCAYFVWQPWQHGAFQCICFVCVCIYIDIANIYLVFIYKIISRYIYFLI